MVVTTVTAVRVGEREIGTRGITLIPNLEPESEKPQNFGIIPFSSDMGYHPERVRRINSIVAAPGIDLEKLRAALGKADLSFKERGVIAKIEELMMKLKDAQDELLVGFPPH